jgi:hypothetical protein
VRVLNRVLFVELAMGAVWGELQNVRYHRAGSKRAEDVAGYNRRSLSRVV